MVPTITPHRWLRTQQETPVSFPREEPCEVHRNHIVLVNRRCPENTPSSVDSAESSLLTEMMVVTNQRFQEVKICFDASTSEQGVTVRILCETDRRTVANYRIFCSVPVFTVRRRTIWSTYIAVVLLNQLIRQSEAPESISSICFLSRQHVNLNFWGKRFDLNNGRTWMQHHGSVSVRDAGVAVRR